jgi:hypothetical protein
MLYFDSWVWLKYFSENECWEQARNYIDDIGDLTVLIFSIVLLDVKYRFAQKFGSTGASRVIRTIESFNDLMVLPVSDEVAKRSASVGNIMSTGLWKCPTGMPFIWRPIESVSVKNLSQVIPILEP